MEHGVLGVVQHTFLKQNLHPVTVKRSPQLTHMGTVMKHSIPLYIWDQLHNQELGYVSLRIAMVRTGKRHLGR